MPKANPIRRDWPAHKIETWPVEDLVPYARNAKQHPDEQVAQIAASIEEFGFTIPVLCADDGTIIAGHGRVLAAKFLGVAEVPVIVARGWSDAQRRAYTLADNRLTEGGKWDEDLLALELGDLREEGFDLGLTGFDARSIERLLEFCGDDGNTDADEVPEAPAVPASRPGDLWVLGHHRIVCGDSTDAATVERLLAGEEPHLMVADPPYGVEYKPGWRNEVIRSNGTKVAARATGKVLNDDRADWREAWALFPGDVAYVWHGALHASKVHDSLVASGFAVRSQVIWDKTRLVIGRGDYHWQHEPCWYAVRKGKTGHWQGDRSQTTVWPIVHVKSETGHGTQKPVECMKRPIENNSEPGDAVYEPFSGSGTTIIAATMTGRRCFAVELNPVYVDVAVKRWQAFTGETAVLEGDGRSFDEVAAERLPAAA